MSEQRNSVIVLLGYMGSGKTTVGQELARSMGVGHVDLDAYIESVEKATIPEIMSQKGVIYFRKAERVCLETFLQTANRVVLSLGGGAPCYYDNMELINSCKSTSSFYLQANVSFLTDRLNLEKEHRPLIADIPTRDLLSEFIGKHLLERSEFYDKADYKIPIQGKTPQKIASEIKSLVERDRENI